MLKKRLLAMYLGVILGQLAHLTIPFIKEKLIAYVRSQDFDPSSLIAVLDWPLLWFTVIVVFFLFLYVVSDRILIDQKWFRKTFSFFRLGYPLHEGLWAVDLTHHKFTFSLAQIKYHKGSDSLQYTGHAYENDNSLRDDAQWRSEGFHYDTITGSYYFRATGTVRTVSGTTIATVESIGYLTPDDNGLHMEGTALEYSWPTTTGTAECIQFQMHLYRVERTDIKKALNKKPWQRTGLPQTPKERIAVIKQTLQRVGLHPTA